MMGFRDPRVAEAVAREDGVCMQVMGLWVTMTLSQELRY